MADVPAGCQALADLVSTLDQQYGALAAQVSQEEGAQAWQDLARLGGVRQQLAAVQAALDGCVQGDSAALTGVVNVIDATDTATQGAQTVTLWDVSGASAVAAGQAAVTSGVFSLKGPVPAKPALTVQTTGAAGFDLRTGPLPDPLPPPPLRCEMVICPQVLVPPAAVQSWASSFKAVSQQVGSPSSQTSVAVALGSVTVALAAGTITVTATGTLTGTIDGIVPLNQTPFSAEVPFSLTPSGSPQAGDIVNFAIAESGPVIKILGSGPIAVLNAFISTFQPTVINQLQTSLRPWVEQVMPEFVAAALALPQLPPSTTITLRSLKIDESGITLQPVLGTVGTGLSTFKPAPLPAS